MKKQTRVLLAPDAGSHRDAAEGSCAAMITFSFGVGRGLDLGSKAWLT
jgi:hypothetical protein